MQQKDNETLTVYVYQFKTADKCCTFDNHTVVISIFVEGLQDVHTTAAKIYKKDPQTLSEIIRLVKTQYSITTNSLADIHHGSYDI